MEVLLKMNETYMKIKMNKCFRLSKSRGLSVIALQLSTLIGMTDDQEHRTTRTDPTEHLPACETCESIFCSVMASTPTEPLAVTVNELLVSQ